MNETSGGAASAPATREKPGEGFIGFGLGIGFIVVLCAMVAAGGLPYAAAWTIETALFIGSFAGMTLYKRNRWGWALTGYVVAVCLAEAVAHVLGAAGSSAGGLFWAAFGTIGLGWLCVLSLERHRTAVPSPVQHVVNHHVFHGVPAGVQLPDGALASEVDEVPNTPWVTAPRQRPAIEAHPVRAASSHLAGAMAALRNRARF
jgi:hypothetical protein